MTELEHNPKHPYFIEPSTLVFGITKNPPAISNLPAGAKVRLRMKANDLTTAIVKDGSMVSIYDVQKSKDGKVWELVSHPRATNVWL